uniref:NADH dehydrogenase subunit 6 n=1 Tax=Nurudea yanoniella TaxID=509176 RepID=A0A1Z1MWE5_9HEMI|nr:NADH dehydrogenase subunit 6 [Nurudea yanoniella]ARW70279.1 NADH dehydrogenase subunit 6 [Nurudea yanoniella]QBK84296.1 NADH dehydrogenase subunit 6 [Nurudea yanoniella]
MLIKMIMWINLMMSMTLIILKSPLKSNLLILFQTIMLTMMINLINKTSWISFMIVILYIGGLMIIFLYISSIAFNEINMHFNYKNIIKNLMIMSMFMYYMKPLMLMENFKFNNLLFEDNFFMINMFNTPNNMMMYFIMMMLFTMLILIIWLLKFNKGPIRQKI